MSFKRILLHSKQFIKRKDGASGIEYAIIAAMVAVVLAGFIPTMGTNVSSVMTTIQKAIAPPAPTSGGGGGTTTP